MVSITSILALFILLLISSAVFFVSKKIKLPYTVLLVTVGLVMVPVLKLPFLAPTFGFINDIVLTPELLFYIFLPVLIFESAFNMNMRKIVENIWHIGLLSVVGLLISATIISVALYFGLNLIGLPVPFILTLLFGAIISSTDPVAVLALFKEYGAPKRLSLIFEGESLFNDGTAVALFLIILEIAVSGFHGSSTVAHGLFVFVTMVFAGILFGVGMATIFSRALRYTKSNEFVSITVLIVSAHIVFIVSDLVNLHGILGLKLHISPIIATTVSSLFLGNYARHILSPNTDEYLEKSIEHLAFVANSLVFLLAGSLFASTDIDLGVLWLPIVMTIVIVALARIVSVYAVTLPINRYLPDSRIPNSWQTLLAWGSLRGALAIIVVYLIPDNFTLEGWNYAYTPKQLLFALVIGCILATLFVKATTIGPLLKRLGITKPSPLQEAYELDLGSYYLLTELKRTQESGVRGFIQTNDLAAIQSSLNLKLRDNRSRRKTLANDHGQATLDQSLHMMAIATETRYLKDLYSNGEVGEAIYRKIKGKLGLQKEKIEYAQHENINPSSYIDRRDVFDRLVLFSQTVLSKKSTETPLEESYQYYRTQSIIARKVVKTLEQMQKQYGTMVFDKQSLAKILTTYKKYRSDSQAKADNLLKKHALELAEFTTDLSQRSLLSSGKKALSFMKNKGLVDEITAERLEHHYLLDPRD